MPFFGLGLHVLVAIFFAIHAYRSGQNMYWLFILLAFPLLGSIVYFFVVYLPSTRIESGAKKVVAIASKVLDPTRELREAKAAFEYTPSAQNQVRLASALFQAGFAEEAAANYEACLKKSLFSEDPEIHFGAALALVECQQYEKAISHLEFILGNIPSYRAEPQELLLARALAGAGRNDQAKARFDAALHHFNSFNTRAEYAIWAVKIGDQATADRLRAEIEEAKKGWNRHTRELNAPLLQRLYAAYEDAKKSG